MGRIQFEEEMGTVMLMMMDDDDESVYRNINDICLEARNLTETVKNVSNDERYPQIYFSQLTVQQQHVESVYRNANDIYLEASALVETMKNVSNDEWYPQIYFPQLTVQQQHVESQFRERFYHTDVISERLLDKILHLEPLETDVDTVVQHVLNHPRWKEEWTELMEEWAPLLFDSTRIGAF